MTKTIIKTTFIKIWPFINMALIRALLKFSKDYSKHRVGFYLVKQNLKSRILCNILTILIIADSF